MIKHLIPFLFTTPCIAADLVIGGFSYHIGEREYEEVDSSGHGTGEFKRYNEINPTLGFCVDDNCLVASKLSYDNWGVVAYHEFTFAITRYVDFGVRLGGALGYDGTPQGGVINPYVSALSSFKIEEWKVQLGLIPTDPMAVTINAKYKF